MCLCMYLMYLNVHCFAQHSCFLRDNWSLMELNKKKCNSHETLLPPHQISTMRTTWTPWQMDDTTEWYCPLSIPDFLNYSLTFFTLPSQAKLYWAGLGSHTPKLLELFAKGQCERKYQSQHSMVRVGPIVLISQLCPWLFMLVGRRHPSMAVFLSLGPRVCPSVAHFYSSPAIQLTGSRGIVESVVLVLG
jgi:hypothetical protein